MRAARPARGPRRRAQRGRFHHTPPGAVAERDQLGVAVAIEVGPLDVVHGRRPEPQARVDEGARAVVEPHPGPAVEHAERQVEVAVEVDVGQRHGIAGVEDVGGR